jgi:pyruvate/2-oxoacid:ferredoxin oxidoreductase beta subunit/Pyruvate/2-oxoacid:ferredoxin oxidoreductase gamma subunit
MRMEREASAEREEMKMEREGFSRASGVLVKDAPLPYCKGCGHGFATRALGDALERLGRPAHEIVLVTDIGCVGLADSLFATPHTVHTTHGRSTAFATGLGLADSTIGTTKLKPVVLIGDGGAMIGLNHLVHAALINADVTVLVHNNFMFGMTGGQNSAFSPEAFVTATTPAGNTVPPLDLARLLLACRASFVARTLASDRQLADTIRRAIDHPGFAMVEILELCTGFATKWNTLTGATLRQVADRAGYELGILHEARRPTFAEANRGRDVTAKVKKKAGATPHAADVSAAGAAPSGPVRLVLAGTAGERVQTAATLLASAGLSCGLEVTQKNDYPVTQGTGFSVSEVILSPGPIDYTGIERPDVVFVVSDDGLRELARNGTVDRIGPHTLVIADASLTLPEVPGRVRRLPVREVAGGKQAALAAVASWAAIGGVVPFDALAGTVEGKFGGEEGATLREVVERLR